jgi:SAM-dependent methyltransferase
VIAVAKIVPFEKYTDHYEDWFDRHEYIYNSELKAIKELLPLAEKGIEIGVGSGRFAIPLGIKFGLEPSMKMREIARNRGVDIVGGIAEALPFKNNIFDIALMVTVICFVDDLITSFKEAFRILKNDAYLIVSFIDRDSPGGEAYFQHRKDSLFYRQATFYSTAEVATLLKEVGFRKLTFRQTIFRALSEIVRIEQAKPGYGEGSFVVVRALK